jgi:hypothetical protein
VIEESETVSIKKKWVQAHKLALNFWLCRNPLIICLLAVCCLAVCLRLLYSDRHGDDPGYNNMVLTYGSVAQNLLVSNGYFTSVSNELNHAATNADYILPISDLKASAMEDRQRPISYYTPGYAYIVAGLWMISGVENHSVAQSFQAIFNGVVGCTAIFALLWGFRLPLPGLIAAAGYAVAPHLIMSSNLFLPHSFGASVPLVSLAAIAVGYRTNHFYSAAALAGFVSGISIWLRPEAIVLLPVILTTILAFSRNRVQERVTICGVFIAFWLIPSISMGIFNQTVYSEFHMTRPGTGILLWEGLRQETDQPKTGIRQNSDYDAAAAEFLLANGRQYGGWEGDALLFRDAIKDIKQEPWSFLSGVINRFKRVIVLDVELSGSALGIQFHILRDYVLLPGLILLLIIGTWLLREIPLLAVLNLLTWLAYALPLACGFEEWPYLVMLIPPYLVAGGVLATRIVEALNRVIMARRASSANM